MEQKFVKLDVYKDHTIIHWYYPDEDEYWHYILSSEGEIETYGDYCNGGASKLKWSVESAREWVDFYTDEKGYTIFRLEKENEEWQACYDQQVELGKAQYHEMRKLVLILLEKRTRLSNALDSASQHGVNWRILS